MSPQLNLHPHPPTCRGANSNGRMFTIPAAGSRQRMLLTNRARARASVTRTASLSDPFKLGADRKIYCGKGDLLFLWTVSIKGLSLG